MWTCERWPTLSGRCQVSFKEAGEELGPWFLELVSLPSLLLFLLHSSIDYPFLAFCFLIPDRLLEPRWKSAAVHCIGGTTDLLLIIPRTLW